MSSTRLDELRTRLAEPMLQPRGDELRGECARVSDWFVEHFTSLPEQPIGRTATRSQMEAALRRPIPERGRSFAEVFAEFRDGIAPLAMRVNHPRFFAFIPSSPTSEAVLGDWLCAACNFFAGVWYEAAGPAMIELLVLDWFKSFLGMPAEASGLLTGGGSEANLIALVVARDAIDIDQRGRAVLYVSEQRHWSIDRAARIAGFRPEQLRVIPADAEFRLRARPLREAVQLDRQAGRIPWMVVANAGATNTGTVDALDEVAACCRDESLWLHVDAAYGWAAALVDRGRAELAGIARADSITLDPHKWFAQTFDAGGLLVRDGKRLANSFALRPDYMQDVAPADDEINFADHGIALTRRFRALKIWLSIEVLGLAWFRTLVERSLDLAEYAQLRLESSPHFEILSPRRLSIVCFRCLHPRRRLDDSSHDQWNLTLLERLRASGRAFLSSTRLRGVVALRMCFVNWRATSADVDEVVALLERLAQDGVE